MAQDALAKEQRNKDVVNRFVEATSSLQVDLLDDLVVEDYIEHDPVPGQPQGREGLKEAYRLFNTPFPDLYIAFEDVIAEGDYVVGRGVLNGTHKSEFFGVPPSNKKLYWTGTRLFRMRDFKIAEGWANINMVTLLQQLGLAPTPPGTQFPAPRPEPPKVVGGRPSTRAENRALMERFIEEVWNKRNLAVADEVFHPEASSPSAPDLPRGPEGVKMIAQMFFNAFPDYWMRIDRIVAEDDRVAARFTQGGTHEGDLMGIAPTGKKAEWTEMGILRIEGGQVVESWYDVDMVGMMQQLGVGG
jgi:steroid delta-isomerase-like uncharacterized protein